jgi:uncharacterized membrane protein
MSIAVALGLLSLALGAAFPLFAWHGYSSQAVEGVRAAGVALGVCWFGAATALLVVHFARQAPMPALLGSIFFRMGFPLIVGIWLDSQGGSLARAGVFGMIVVYYLIALVVEVVLSLRVAPIPAKSSKAV